MTIFSANTNHYSVSSSTFLPAYLYSEPIYNYHRLEMGNPERLYIDDDSLILNGNFKGVFYGNVKGIFKRGI